MSTAAARARVALLAAVVALAACTDGSAPTELPAFSKGGGKNPGGGGVSVSTVEPSFGRRGDVSLDVVITGSGFEAGSEATWERGGEVEQGIHVHETRFVSSTEVVATISIADDAELTYYDVAVTRPDRKKGIATESFEVTQALIIGTLGSNAVAYGANDAGEVVGVSLVGNTNHAFIWTAAEGIRSLGPGDAREIDDAGAIIVGVQSDRAVVWTSSANGWSAAQPLPVSPTSVGSRAYAVARHDDGTVLVAGEDLEKGKGNSKVGQPTLWVRSPAGEWTRTRLQLPAGATGGWTNDVNAAGQVVGHAGAAVFWEADGTPTVIGPSGSGARGLNAAGNMIVGVNETRAVYYRREGSTWSGPHDLPGNCARALAISDDGTIVGSRCPVGSSRYVPAIWTGPEMTLTLLGGLGGSDEPGAAWNISNGGTYIAGSATTKPSRVAVYWSP